MPPATSDANPSELADVHQSSPSSSLRWTLRNVLDPDIAANTDNNQNDEGTVGDPRALSLSPGGDTKTQMLSTEENIAQPNSESQSQIEPHFGPDHTPDTQFDQGNNNLVDPHFTNLTPWPYLALAVITLILTLVLGYALYNCCRSLKVVQRKRGEESDKGGTNMALVPFKGGKIRGKNGSRVFRASSSQSLSTIRDPKCLYPPSVHLARPKAHARPSSSFILSPTGTHTSFLDLGGDEEYDSSDDDCIGRTMEKRHSISALASLNPFKDGGSKPKNPTTNPSPTSPESTASTLAPSLTNGGANCTLPTAPSTCYIPYTPTTNTISMSKSGHSVGSTHGGVYGMNHVNGPYGNRHRTAQNRLSNTYYSGAQGGRGGPSASLSGFVASTFRGWGFRKK